MPLKPVSQEVVYDNVKRFKKEVEMLTDVTGGYVHISTHCHPVKHREPWQCWPVVLRENQLED